MNRLGLVQLGAVLLQAGLAVGCGEDSTAPPGSSGNAPGDGGSGGSSSGSGGETNAGASGDAGASAGGAGGAPNESPRGELAINEVMSQNEGAWIDERGEADDWLELTNRSEATLELANYGISDGVVPRAVLPSMQLQPGQSVIVWVDSDPDQGPLHVPFKLTAGGDRIVLTREDGQSIDSVEVPALEVNQVFARFPSAEGSFSLCRYASPGEANGESCAPKKPLDSLDDVEFESFAFPAPFPAPPGGLAFNELHLRPAPGAEPFIELVNLGATAVELGAIAVRLGTHAPSSAWPGIGDGEAIPLPAGASLASGQLVSIAVPEEVLAALAQDPAFEGVITAFDAATELALDRVDFMRWPVGSALARKPEAPALFEYCTNTTSEQPNTCDVLPSRDVGDRVRHLRTPGDFAALSEGAELVGIQSTKFIVDLAAPGLVHLIGSARWPLHYTFIRELVYLEPALDRCDPVQNQQFYEGWVDFSLREYYVTEGRRFHLGTLSHHASTGLDAVEYTFGDAITAEQMRDAFLAVTAHVDHPERWAMRPQDSTQVAKVREIEGRAPLVGPNTPFIGMTFQPLTEGTTYGTLKFVPADELLTTSLGPTTIVITDDVPNDVPLVGGLITEAFQTPLAHVNVLSKNRGTPNAALQDARTELATWLDQLVKLIVSPTGIHVEPADPVEAAEFWESRMPAGEPVSPRLDSSVRGIQDLSGHGLDSLPMIGAKAAQLAELLRIGAAQPACVGGLPFIVPEAPLAIPLVHYREHFTASGAEARLAELERQADFVADSLARARGLAEVRRLMLEHPVDAELLAAVEAALEERFGQERVRFRSSSNTEDLPTFNGAGLYTSISAELGDPERLVADAMRTVWASLWNSRAYDERAFARIDAETLAMGILVHPASLSEQGNGVGVSRNILDPTRGDQYYVNVQIGEASVTNPAPAVTTEQLVYQWDRSPPILYQSRSSLLRALPAPPATVLTPSEARSVACALNTVHAGFRPLIDPALENPWFAMEIEFKLIGTTRQLHVKQARPHSFGRVEIIADCREL